MRVPTWDRGNFFVLERTERGLHKVSIGLPKKEAEKLANELRDVARKVKSGSSFIVKKFQGGSWMVL